MNSGLIAGEDCTAAYAKGKVKMGKFIGYTFLIITILLALEWFQIVDVPYLEIPDYTSGKKAIIESSEDTLDQTK